jgi:hypothetical protein
MNRRLPVSLFLLCLVSAITVTVSAQSWTPSGNNTYWNSGNGSVAIGSAPVTEFRLRLSNPPVDTIGGGGQLMLGTAAGGYWLWRLDSQNRYNLDRFNSVWTNTMMVDMSGRVGIGAVPADRLTIFGGTSNINIGGNFGDGYNAIWLNGGTSRTDYNIISSAAEKNLYINRPAGFNLHFREGNGNNSQMTIGQEGRVGIGTLGPTERLHLASFEGASVRAMIERAGIGVDAALIFRTAGIASTQWMLGKAANGLAFPTSESLHLGFGNFNAPVMTFGFDYQNQPGFVGINTTVPYAPLEITAKTNGGINDALMLTSNNMGAQVNEGTGIAFTAFNHSRYARIAGVGEGSNNEQALTFWTQNTAGGLAERMRITGAGVMVVGKNGDTGTRLLVRGEGVTLEAGDGTTSNRKAYSDYVSRETAAAAWRAGMNGAVDYTVTDVTNPAVPVTRITMTRAGQLTVNGDISATGKINAKYQDVAEWVPASVDMAPGTVVVLNRDRSNEVMPSMRAYDTAVAGVVSGQPGIVLGEEGIAKEQIATTGRVRVRVDARRAPIAVGDLLVTSDQPGVAMKSQPVVLSGIEMHRPGTVVGKALEPLPEGEGEILVLLSLQ